MLINKLLEKTSQLLNLESLNYLASPSSNTGLIQSLVKVENRSVITQLKQMLNQYGGSYVNLENLKVFADFLAYRWQEVKSTLLSYPHSPNNSATIICHQLAKDLATARCYSEFCDLTLLMPTIKPANAILATNLNLQQRESEDKDKIRLTQFVLSDDNTTIIYVYDCLADARLDNEYKHTSKLYNDQRVQLSLNEKNRVIHHSSYAAECARLINKVFELKYAGGSVGVAINRLIKYLKFGGVEAARGGTDDTAGKESYQGIKDFYHFCQKLEKDKKDFLWAKTTPRGANNLSFKACWLNLLMRINPADHQIDFTPAQAQEIQDFIDNDFRNIAMVPCVEVIAKYMQKILDSHPILYETYANRIDKTTDTIKLIKTQQAALSQKLVELDDATKADHFEVLFNYGLSGERKLETRICKNSIKDFAMFKEIIIALTAINNDRIFEKLLNKMNSKSFIQTPEQLCEILTICSTAFQVVLLEFLNERHLRFIIKSNVIFQNVC
jgi:hypothetical protein